MFFFHAFPSHFFSTSFDDSSSRSGAVPPPPTASLSDHISFANATITTAPKTACSPCSLASTVTDACSGFGFLHLLLHQLQEPQDDTEARVSQDVAPSPGVSTTRSGPPSSHLLDPGSSHCALRLPKYKDGRSLNQNNVPPVEPITS